MTDDATTSAQPTGPGPTDDVLALMLDRIDRSDAADAPDLAGAIASILANRLEGTPLPDEVQALVASVEGQGPSTEPPR